jgi:hypothetical protein
MKAFLMYRDRDFDPQRKLPSNEQALTQDLELNTLFNAMALGDGFLFEVAKKAVLSSINDVDTILYSVKRRPHVATHDRVMFTTHRRPYVYQAASGVCLPPTVSVAGFQG